MQTPYHGLLVIFLQSEHDHQSKFFPASQPIHMLLLAGAILPFLRGMDVSFSPFRALLKCHFLRETQLEQLISN